MSFKKCLGPIKNCEREMLRKNFLFPENGYDFLKMSTFPKNTFAFPLNHESNVCRFLSSKVPKTIHILPVLISKDSEF